MLREIKSPQRLERRLAFRVTGTGTAVIDAGGKHATLTDNGTGDYTFTFVQPFKRVPCVTGLSPIATAGDVIMTIHSVSVTAVRVLAWDGTDGTTAKDAVFHLEVAGWDSTDET